jgi:hypothetical protein
MSAVGGLRSSSAVWLLVVATLAAAGGGGCGVSADFPRTRLGSLPCFGWFTLYRPADPNRLGQHRYERVKPIDQPSEAEHGILYTTHAGFLDLAHLRMAIDWTRYCTAQIHRAIDEQADEVSLTGANGAVFVVRLHYPDDLPPPGTPEHDALAEELALRAGQRVAYLILTWHELVTWFGHRNVTLIDESPSAFTYDDVMAHVVGLRIAERALRDPTRPFDAAATVALKAELRRLGAVTPRQTDAALRAVEGLWWAGSLPIKRQINVGLEDGAVRPWLVPDLPFVDADIKSEPFQLPTLGTVDGRDFTDFYSVLIDPRIPEARRMRRYLPGRPELFCPERDLPVLLRVARDQMRKRLSPDVDQPWPVLANGG